MLSWLGLLLAAAFLRSTAADQCRLRCGQELREPLPEFHFAAACTRSRMNLVSADYAASLAQCKDYTIYRKGLAFNYIHTDLLDESVKRVPEENCMVFDCPELDVQLSLEMNSLYDYYTAYARPIPNTNVTCVPRLGMFQIHHLKRNFSEAEEACAEENGYLADITSWIRSVQLGSILFQSKIDQAFIGIAFDDGVFMTTTGWPLNCLTYRGWAPGEPRNSRGCGTLSTSGLWYTTSCKERLPFVCELRTSGPSRPCQQVEEYRERRRCKHMFRSSHPTEERSPRCGDPDIGDAYKLPVPDQSRASEDRQKNSTQHDNKHFQKQET